MGLLWTYKFFAPYKPSFTCHSQVPYNAFFIEPIIWSVLNVSRSKLSFIINKVWDEFSIDNNLAGATTIRVLDRKYEQ